MKHTLRMSKLTLGLLTVLAAAPAFAQNTSAGVAGQVTSSVGAPVAGAEVTITHVESGTVSRATTDASGRYNARGLRVGGPYTITITKSGEGTKTEQNVFLSLSQTNTVNGSLGGDLTATTLEAVQVMAVAGGSDLFSANKMGTGSSVSQEQIEALPSINRNIQDYVRLDPRISQSDKSRGELTVGGQNPRYNAIRIDGVNTSDTFGLESNGFPTLRQPVSMDAIEAINIDVANYDTTITGATGAVIDAVTKSGTNEFHGSVYGTYRDKDMVGDHPDTDAKFTGFEDEKTFGATFGGPIIKDKLFFFANYEKFERSRAASSYGPRGSNAVNEIDIDPAFIAEAQQIAQSVYGVDLGTSDAPTETKQEVEEYAAKIDWNINDDHRLSARFSKLEQTDPNLGGSSLSTGYSGHGMSTTGPALALSSRWFDVTKEVETSVVQLFSDWSDNFSTEFKVGRRTYDSLSSVYSRLPSIVIGSGPANGNVPPPYLVAGADEFRHGNQINTETTTAYGAANWYVGDHTIKFGFDWESNDIYNLYAQNIWGTYGFANLDDFRNGRYQVYDLNAPVPGQDLSSVAMQYKHKNAGLFVQDTWAVNYNLSLMFGLRVDIPDLDAVPVHNLLVQEIYGYDNRETLDKALVQPRFGFNYTFDSDRPTQLRGGVGLFQGAAANVWVGNSYQNSGFGLIGYNARAAGLTPAQREAMWASLPVSLDVDSPTVPSPAGGYTSLVNLMDKGIRQPSVWKANLAFDHELPWYGITGSVELLYTKVKDAIAFERLDLGNVNAVRGQDGRDMYWSNPYAGTGVRAGSNAGVAAAADAIPGYENITGWHNDGVILLKNTDKGRSTQFTASLSKPLTDNWGWSLGYTYTDATEVSPLTSSRAISNWNGVIGVNPNDAVASTSNYEIKNRVTGSLQFRKAFFGDNDTTFSLFYEGRSGLPYSWRFLNDANGDGYSNDSLYVPAGRGDVLFTGGAAMEDAFFEFLDGEVDLSRFAGGIAPRNSAHNKWVNTFDIRISQELPAFFEGHKAEIWVDVMNVGNLLNKDWGKVSYASPFSGRGAVNFAGIDQATGKYIYNYNANNVTKVNLTDWESRWSLQVGFRYKF
ncbi:TonB-dependent receptor [Stenotrophomonas sp. CFBP8980]|uniref:TonB-dependent receptor n=1 Tax=Stenotrophomonas sp. CFBP8980 TaxID=3096523 RepID=UPI002A6A4F4C|nr:carboxypeptidase regulatory-like domain-containing protein [Stenotrophomonas sp. CFBP8980]MDY1034972.1 carboxypeptidase regulatory-like domain-containing protein [Stenotrophomonas sp. CFBP8980]